MIHLTTIGFWHCIYEPDLPDPANFTNYEYSDGITKAVLDHLKNGREINSYRGLSWCRFNCGCDPFEMGYTELTDGKFIWPFGLIHYVEKHGVSFPQEFIDHVLSKKQYYIPDKSEFSRIKFDTDWWDNQKGIPGKSISYKWPEPIGLLTFRRNMQFEWHEKRLKVEDIVGRYLQGKELESALENLSRNYPVYISRLLNNPQWALEFAEKAGLEASYEVV